MSTSIEAAALRTLCAAASDMRTEIDRLCDNAHRSIQELRKISEDKAGSTEDLDADKNLQTVLNLISRDAARELAVAYEGFMSSDDDTDPYLAIGRATRLKAAQLRTGIVLVEKAMLDDAHQAAIDRAGQGGAD